MMEFFHHAARARCTLDFMHIVIRRTAGVACLVIGIVALVTPMTPGSLLFIVGGLELLGLSFLIPRP